MTCAPSNPDWYYNLIAAGESSVERGPDTSSMEKNVQGPLLTELEEIAPEELWQLRAVERGRGQSG